jgi:hypothetical protein
MLAEALNFARSQTHGAGNQIGGTLRLWLRTAEDRHQPCIPQLIPRIAGLFNPVGRQAPTFWWNGRIKIGFGVPNQK